MVKVNTLDENKLLLFSDIAARVPYNPRMRLSIDIHHVDDLGEETIEHQEENSTLIGAIHHDDVFVILNESHNWFDIEEVKLYLRPMSNMTKDEEDELDKIDNESSRIFFDDLFERKKKEGRENLKGFLPDYPTLDWLNSHHFDYRDLIKKGLALEAPEDMYN